MYNLWNITRIKPRERGCVCLFYLGNILNSDSLCCWAKKHQASTTQFLEIIYNNKINAIEGTILEFWHWQIHVTRRKVLLTMAESRNYKMQIIYRGWNKKSKKGCKKPASTTGDITPWDLGPHESPSILLSTFFSSFPQCWLRKWVHSAQKTIPYRAQSLNLSLGALVLPDVNL